MSKETKNPAKRDQALNDATQGQFGSQPRPTPEPNVERKDQSMSPEDDERKLAERKKYYLGRKGR